MSRQRYSSPVAEPMTLQHVLDTVAAPRRIGLPEGVDMNILAIILIVLAIALFIWWGVVPTLSFLLWVAIILAVIAVIVFLFRYLSGRRAP